MSAKKSVVGKLLGSSQKFNREQVEQTIDMLVDHAYSRGASDIHIEPRERFILVRYRIDGVLRGVHKLPLASKKQLVAEFKLKAKLNPKEVFIPQEGQYTVTLRDKTFVVKVSTLPVLDGEKLVLRLVPQVPYLAPLESLGLWGSNLEHVRLSLTANKGLIVIAGPKRSGKTTSLYSLLHIISTPLASVVSIEDPIEHRLSGISQTQVHPKRGVGFTEGLQAALQQDPNIVMISNLSDKQAIELATHAANSGHLILAGVPADNAARAIIQLYNAGTQSYLLSTALNTVISQRLVRRLCTNCRERFQINDEQRDLLSRAFGLDKVAVRRSLHELEKRAEKSGMGQSEPLNTTAGNITHLWQTSSEGCIKCDYSGYQGQVVLSEVIKFNDTLRTLLQHRPTMEELQATAAENGFIPLFHDGLVKAFRGLTTVEELLRVMPTE